MTARFLNKALAFRYDQNLTKRMRMPSGARARLEGDVQGADTGGVRCHDHRVDSNPAGKGFLRPNSGWTRSGPQNFH